MRPILGIALATFAAALAAGGCVSRSSDSQLERDTRFVGAWMIEQPYHAGYEASVYDFEADGTLTVLDSVTYDGMGSDYVTGSVSDTQSGIRCVFANRWYSTDEATLVIDGNCSDGTYREIVIGFSDDQSANSVDAEVVVLSVDGEDGWSHDDWRWRWRRCDSAAACVPLL